MRADEFADLIQAAVEQAIRERGQMNVLIAGRTGVGKSTLINAVFQGNLAETGQGRPVTQGTREIRKDGIPLTIWDTRGLELAAFDETVRELDRLIGERSRDPDPKRHLHVAWLCVQEDGRRVEDAEVRLHEMLARHVPVVAVVTKARADQGFRAEVQRLLPQAVNVVRVRALSEALDDGHRLPPMGLEALVEVTAEAVPEGQRRALAAAQKASVAYKKKQANRVVLGAAGTAALAGAVPIPFADALALVPLQVGMLAGVSAVFGLDLSQGFLTTLATTALGCTATTLAGRTIVANLLKLVPGAGSLAGGAIAAGTAAALTTALGEAYIGVLVALFSRRVGETPSPDQIAEAFRERLLHD